MNLFHGDLGFKPGGGGNHAARTMMLMDLTALLSLYRAGYCRVDYCVVKAIHIHTAGNTGNSNWRRPRNLSSSRSYVEPRQVVRQTQCIPPQPG